MYDIFISYRHDGGGWVANHLADVLTRDGYSVFIDHKSLGSGIFDQKLFEHIKNCKDFIIVLSKDALESPKENDENNWVQLELMCALMYKKNIIPVKLPEFGYWPKSFGESIDLSNYKCLEYDENFDDSCIKRLYEEFKRMTWLEYDGTDFDNFYMTLKNKKEKEKTFLHSHPSVIKVVRKLMPWFLIIILIAISGYFIIDKGKKKILVCGSGTVKNYLYTHCDTAVMNKYIYIPSPSSSFSKIFLEEKSWGPSFNEMKKNRQYYMVLLSACEKNTKELYNDDTTVNNNCVGYIMGIKLGDCKLRVSWNKEKPIETFKNVSRIDDYHLDSIYNITQKKYGNFKGFLKVDSLAKAMKDPKVNIYTTTTGTSGTYKGFQKALSSFCVNFDSLMNIKEKDSKVKIYYDSNGFDFYDEPYIILGNEYYYANDNQNYEDWAYLVDSTCKIASIPLYIYITIYKDDKFYEIPKEVKDFLGDVTGYDFNQISDTLLKSKKLIRYFDTEKKCFTN